MIDPRKIGQMLMGEWDKTKQPLKERGTILPVGEYEDGSVGFAWPELLAAPARGVANFGSHGYGEDAVPYNAAQAWDAAGGAMTGGLGLGLLGGMADNALGSAGGKLTQPQGIRAYHGTTADDFTKFDESPWFSPDASFASQYATPGDDVLGRVYPVDLKFKKPFSVSSDNYDANWQALGADPSAYNYDLAAAARAQGYDGMAFDMGPGMPNEYQALKPSTVFSATTGEQLYANAPTGAAVPLATQGGQDENEMTRVLRQYGMIP